MRRDRAERNFLLETAKWSSHATQVKINRSDPASPNSPASNALKLSEARRSAFPSEPRHPVPFSAAESLLLNKERSRRPAMVNARLLLHINWPPAPSALVDLSCVGDSKLLTKRRCQSASLHAM